MRTSDKVRIALLLGAFGLYGAFGAFQLWQATTTGQILFVAKRASELVVWPGHEFQFFLAVLYWIAFGPLALTVVTSLAIGIFFTARQPKAPPPRWYPTYDDALRRPFKESEEDDAS